MKKIILSSVVVLFSFIFLVGCSEDNDSATSALIKKSTPITKTVQSTQEPVEEKQKFIPLCDDTLRQIVSFIIKKGANISSNIQNGYQYTFIDSVGTRHALIVSGHDTLGHPSPRGKFVDFSVWSYTDYKNKGKGSDNFFGWGSYEGKVHLLGIQYDKDGTNVEDKKYFDLVKIGYNEFFARFEKWQKSR